MFYEMLTGCAAFAGETVSDTVARILEREPDWSRLPADRFSHVLPEDQSFTNGARPLVAIAPDRSNVVYAANSRLYRRAIADWHAVPIRGTEGSPTTPFFSPDGQTFGYWDAAARELRRIPITGGTPVPLAGAPSVYGASWGKADRVLYAQEDGVWPISAHGGQAERLIPIQPDELAYGPRLQFTSCEV